MAIQADCTGGGFLSLTARSTVDNGTGFATSWETGTNAVHTDSDDNADVNDVIDLNPTLDEGNGQFEYSTINGLVFSYQYLNDFGGAQGDCVTAGMVTTG